MTFFLYDIHLCILDLYFVNPYSLAYSLYNQHYFKQQMLTRLKTFVVRALLTNSPFSTGPVVCLLIPDHSLHLQPINSSLRLFVRLSSQDIFMNCVHLCSTICLVVLLSSFYCQYCGIIKRRAHAVPFLCSF